MEVKITDNLKPGTEVEFYHPFFGHLKTTYHSKVREKFSRSVYHLFKNSNGLPCWVAAKWKVLRSEVFVKLEIKMVRILPDFEESSPQGCDFVDLESAVNKRLVSEKFLQRGE